MRAFDFSIKSQLTRGLRLDSRGDRGLNLLTECKNLKPIKIDDDNFSLVPYELVSDPFKSGEFAAKSITIAFPFPQVFRGKEVTLLADDTKIYTVDESDWSLTLITTYNAFDRSAILALDSTGGPWQFIDMGDTWFLINTKNIVWQSNTHALTNEPNQVYVNKTNLINAGVYHRGRIVTGGFNSSNFWNNDWLDIFTKWKAGLSTQIDLPTTDIDSNWVLWSSIGGGDFPLWLFYPDRAFLGNIRGTSETGYTWSKTMIMDMIIKNQFGFMPLPWQGDVYVIKPLGKELIVYGSNGISALTPIQDPVPTYGLRNISSVGIMGRGAVGGDVKQHVFLDNNGFLWRMTGQEPSRLGYREFFTGFSANTIISFDNRDEEFYISDETNSYLLTPRGLGEAKERVTSLVDKVGVLSGVIEDSGDSESQVVTDTIDFGSIATIQAVHLPMVASADVDVAIDYRYDYSSSFVRSPFIRVNNQGVAFMLVSASQVRIVIKSSDYSNMDLDEIEYTVQFADKRFRRSLSASQVTP